MTDDDWVEIVRWMQANGLRLVVPIKGPFRFERKPTLLTERDARMNAFPLPPTVMSARLRACASAV